MIRPVPALLLALLAVAPALADFELGLQAYERGDYSAALAEWRPMAEAGDVDAQYRLGRMYYAGEGVDPEPAIAGEWYRRAAEQGHVLAQVNLGFLYEHGEGVARDETRAAHWYALAAAQGHDYAQYAMARFHLEGRGGLPTDDGRAADWCRKAAEQGLPEAQFLWARLLESGRGVERSPKKAAKWYRRAAKRGYEGDRPDAAPVDAPVDAPEEAESPEEAEGVEEPVTAELDPDEAYRAATRYRTGDGAERDEDRAGRLYVQAAEAGHGLAAYQVALLYLRGRVVSRHPDYVRAWAWFEVAARKHVGDAADWRDRTAAKMTDDELEDARHLSDSLFVD